MAGKEASKFVLVGDFGVGKTTIYTRFKTGKGRGGSLNTVKDSEFTKPVMVDGRSIPVSCS